MTGDRFEPGQLVDVVPTTLHKSLVHEHKRGKIKKGGISLKPGIHQRQRLQSSRSHTTKDIIENLLGANNRRSHGPILEILSYPNKKEHHSTTYYNVVFDEGVGIYPEECLIPIPEDSIKEQEEADTTDESDGWTEIEVKGPEDNDDGEE